MMPTLPVIQDLNPSEWMSSTTPWYFLASLEFKCMQRSKPPFRRKRWCNKPKPPDYSHSGPSFTETAQPSHTVRSWNCKLPPGGRSAQECFFPSRLFQLFVCLSVVHACVHLQMQTELHIKMNIYFLGDNLNVYKQLHIIFKKPVQTSHHRRSKDCDDIAFSLWSYGRITPVCGPGVTSQGHDLPVPPTTHSSIAALQDQGSAASLSYTSSWPPIYTRLLIASCIHFPGRQSNKTLLGWGYSRWLL